MDEKSGQGLWDQEFYKKAKEFIRGDIVESDWEEYHAIHNSKHHFEIPLLKEIYSEFSDFVRMLSVKNRRRILLDAYSTGFTRIELEKAGVSSKRVGKFVRMQNIKDDEISCRFLSLLSLFCRVPMHWLTEEHVVDIWDNEHLFQMPVISMHKFTEYLRCALGGTREVRGFRITLGSNIFRVRVQILSNGFLVEFYHESIADDEFTLFKETLKQFQCIPGYMHTVIPSRTHRALFGHSFEQRCFENPSVEFYTDEAKMPCNDN